MNRCIFQACGSKFRPLSAPITALNPLCPGLLRFHRSLTISADFESKYAEKLRRRAKEKGLSVDDLKSKIKEEQEERRQRETSAALPLHASSKSASRPSPAPAPIAKNVRKDSSPVKPLSSILNLPRIMSTPHTATQISALWTAFHVSRSGGTGRGYVCASVPLELYRKMTSAAERYPTFVVPVPRVRDPATPLADGEESTAYEFYFLQWDFHDVPPVPGATEDPFVLPVSASPSAVGVNPPTSTILFTPLQEYKMRASFATPYIVLTHYTDLAHTHGVVLLRGEITPASAAGGGGVDGRYMLSQEDAQVLSMTVQKFYLWGGEGQKQGAEGERLLKCFHETPENFKWEELLQHANGTI